jgi:MOSC domain
MQCRSGDDWEKQMPTLVETPFAGEIVWLGHVPADGSLQAGPVTGLDLGFDGVTGGRHQGVTLPSCLRVRDLHPPGTVIGNVRQLSILAGEQLDEIAARMGLETLDPRLLGASIVLRGIPDFTHVPPSARLQGPSGVTLVVDMENRPCVLPGQEIEAEKPGYGTAFKPAAKGRRGVCAWVQRPGRLAVGDVLKLFVPDQRGWAP